MCIKAVKALLDTKEALQITMSCNTAEFDSRFFTQIDGATISSPDSGSVTDIFIAIHIDKVIQESCPIPLEDNCYYA